MWRRLIKWTNNTCIQTSIFSVVLTFIKFSVEYYIPCPNKEFTKTSNLICSCYFMYTLYSVLYICYQLLNEKCLQNAIVQQTYVQLQLAFQLQVALLYGGSFYCAGAIISPTCVVTAAYCVWWYVCTSTKFLSSEFAFRARVKGCTCLKESEIYKILYNIIAQKWLLNALHLISTVR